MNLAEQKYIIITLVISVCLVLIGASMNYLSEPVYVSVDIVNADSPIEEVTGSSAILQPALDSEAVAIDARLYDIQNAIKKYEQNNNENLFLYFQDETRTYEYNSSKVTRSASLIKITVMIETFRQIYNGDLSRDKVISRYNFRGTVSEALYKMMNYSNNSATGALISAVGGTDQINKTISEYLGEERITKIYHTPGMYFETGASNNNVTTTEEQVRLIKLLENREVVSAEASEEMLALMSKTHDYFAVRRIDGIESIAFKTGYFPDYLFGLTGRVQKEDGSSYLFSIIVEDWKGGSAKWTGIKELLALLNEYADIK